VAAPLEIIADAEGGKPADDKHQDKCGGDRRDDSEDEPTTPSTRRFGIVDRSG
jgi:hypothetical protein